MVHKVVDRVVQERGKGKAAQSEHARGSSGGRDLFRVPLAKLRGASDKGHFHGGAMRRPNVRHRNLQPAHRLSRRKN